MRLKRAAAVLAVSLALSGCSLLGGDSGPPPSPLPAPSRPTTGSDPADDPALARFYQQDLQWKQCGDKKDEVECADLTVPVDWSATAGETIKIAVARRRADGPADDRLGSLVFNPGGPGVGGVDYVAERDRLLGRAVRRHYDFVSFDPRGVGQSAPIECLSDKEMAEYLQVDSTPDDAGELTAAMAANARFGRACQAESGPVFAHVDTLSVARDLDVLRSALGDQRLTFWGASYGTFLGAWYAETFPWRVGRMLLDGAVDPSEDLAGYVEGQARGFDRAMRGFVEDCLGGSNCPLRGSLDDGLAQVGTLVDEADDAPLSTDQDRELTQSLMITAIAQGLYNEGLWPQLARGLREALRGEGTELLKLADLYLQRDEDGSYGQTLESNPAIVCLDHAEQRTVQQIEADAEALAKRYPPLGGAIGWSGLGCADWPVPGVVPARRVTAEGAAPILVVGTRDDPATPYEAAVALADQLSSGILLTFEGGGHTAYGQHRSKCIDDAVDAYLVAGTSPAAGTSCR